jgi:hypothetical protein
MRAARSIGASIATVIIAVAAGIAASATSASAQSDAGASGSAALPACISVGTEARYVPYGYNHVVLLKNGCSKAATSVEVAASASVEVLTFTASPAQVFHARVTCKLR